MRGDQTHCHSPVSVLLMPMAEADSCWQFQKGLSCQCTLLSRATEQPCSHPGCCSWIFHNKNPGQTAGSGLWPVTRPQIPDPMTRDPVPSLVRVSASFPKNARLVSRLGSEPRVVADVVLADVVFTHTHTKLLHCTCSQWNNMSTTDLPTNNQHHTQWNFCHYGSTLCPKNDTFIDELKQRLIDIWHRIPHGIIDEAIACVKAKGCHFEHPLWSGHTTGSFHNHFRHTKTGSFQSHSHYWNEDNISFSFLCNVS